jgi:hypothetical protein
LTHYLVVAECDSFERARAAEPTATVKPLPSLFPARHSITVRNLARDGTPEPEPTVREVRTVEPTATPPVETTPIILPIPDIICSFAWSCPEALAVAWCESTYRPWVTNGRYLGLYQLDPRHFATYGYDVALWADPWVNAAVAFALHSDAGWQPWECRP